MTEISLLGYDFNKLDLAKDSTRQEIERYARKRLRDLNQSQKRLNKRGYIRTHYKINLLSDSNPKSLEVLLIMRGSIEEKALESGIEISDALEICPSLGEEGQEGYVGYTNKVGEFITLVDLGMGIARYIEDEFVKYWDESGKANTIEKNLVIVDKSNLLNYAHLIERLNQAFTPIAGQRDRIFTEDWDSKPTEKVWPFWPRGYSECYFPRVDWNEIIPRALNQLTKEEIEDFRKQGDFNPNPLELRADFHRISGWEQFNVNIFNPKKSRDNGGYIKGWDFGITDMCVTPIRHFEELYEKIQFSQFRRKGLISERRKLPHFVER